jgi:hypothetical protein
VKKEKECRHCRQTKPVSEFYFGTSADNLHSWCKACCKHESLARYGRLCAERALARKKLRQKAPQYE